MNNGKDFYEKNEVIIVADSRWNLALLKGFVNNQPVFTGNIQEAIKYAKTGSTRAANKLFPKYAMVQQFEFDGYSLRPISRDDKNR